MEIETTPAQLAARTGTPTQDTFTEQLQTKLLGQSDIISSESTKLESKIQEAISGVEKSNQASAAAISSTYAREATQVREAGDQVLTGAREAQRGFAQNTAALDKLAKDTDTQLKDLEQRKQELILQGNSAAASRISDLQTQAIQFRQQAQQQVFSNLLGLANFAAQRDQQRTQVQQFERQQAFQENQAMGEIALQYGVAPRPGETLDSLYSRAVTDMGAESPAALAIAQAKASIASSNAQLKESYRRMQQDDALSALDAESLASAYEAGALSLNQLKNTGQMAAVIRSANTLNASNAQRIIDQLVSQGVSKEDAIAQVTGATSVRDKAAALAYLEDQYGQKPAQKESGVQPFRSPALNSLNSVGEGILSANKNAQDEISTFLFGKPMQLDTVKLTTQAVSKIVPGVGALKFASEAAYKAYTKGLPGRMVIDSRTGAQIWLPFAK